MKHLRLLIALFFASLFALPSTFSQDISTQGTEFWVSFMGNGFKTNGYPTYVLTQLMISSKNDCTGTISNPQTGWSQDFTVRANNITSVDIPEIQGYNETSSHETASNKGLQIVTTDIVSVYCTNIATNSFDASYVLPVQALADDYIIQTYEQSTSYSPAGLSDFSDYLTSAFLIVATEDNTIIDITPSTSTLGGRPANEEFTVTLQKGESYQVRSTLNGNHRDLSGSRVTSRDCNKPIAVFNGNTLTTVPDVTNGFDHIFEQAMPLRSWGKKFVVTQSSSRRRDFVKVTSSANDNIIKKNGTEMATLQAYESISFELSSQDKSCYIETTAPSAVYLYNTTSSDDYGYSHNGDPSMLWISPIEQRMTEVTFTTFSGTEASNSSIDHQYVNIIVASEDINNVTFDNAEIPSNQFETVNGNENYKFIRKEISHNVHQIACPNGFNAHIYGFGSDRGYAYLVGSNAADLSTTIIINGETVQQLDTIGNCSLDPITFGAEINYQNFEVEWDFGDNSPHSHNITDQHTYTDYGVYEVTLTVTSEETPCQASSSVSQTIYIELYHTSDTTLYDNTCYNGPSTYTENGFNIPYDEPGTYEGSKSILSSHGCDSIVHLVLEVGELYQAEPDTVRLCYDDTHPASYTWRDGVTYHTDTHITKTLPYGDCQGIFTLELSFVNNETLVVNWPEPNQYACDSFYWPISGQTYYFSGIYSHVDDLSPFDCTRETQLHLDLSYTPHPYIESYNPYPHWPITATEFNVNRYTFFVNDSISDISKWDKSQCKWEISMDSWRIAPDEDNPLKCVVYAMDWTSDTIWLSFKAVNPCSGEEGVIAKYWLCPSFYGVNDAETTLSNFSIVPNPNNGEMDLHLEQLTGKVSIKVYDMRGALVDVIDTYNELDSKTLHYTMRDISSGIYFFVATAKEGTIAKKVVIE